MARVVGWVAATAAVRPFAMFPARASLSFSLLRIFRGSGYVRLSRALAPHVSFSALARARSPKWRESQSPTLTASPFSALTHIHVQASVCRPRSFCQLRARVCVHVTRERKRERGRERKTQARAHTREEERAGANLFIRFFLHRRAGAAARLVVGG